MLPIYPKTITLDQIQSYSICPRQFGFNIAETIDLPTKNAFRDNVKELIKQSYINRTQHGYSPQWETIKQRVNKLYFSSIDINDKEAFKLASKQSISLLNVMHYWYYKHFSNDTREALVNIPLQVTVNRTILETNLDLAFLDNKYNVIPALFNDNDILPNMLYNNMKFKTLLWMVYKQIEIIPDVSKYIFITDQTVQVHDIFNKTYMDTIDRYINFIIRGIENKIFYPSVSSHCDSCAFKNKCII